MSGVSAGDAEPLDVLHRRVYAPGATEEDRERYRRALASAARPAAAPSSGLRPEEVGGREPSIVDPSVGAVPDRVRPPRRRAPWIRLALIGAVVAGGVAIPALTAAPPTPARVEGTAVLPVPAAARSAFVAALGRTGSAALATYFYDHPDSRPTELLTLTRAETEEHRGTGVGPVALHPSKEADTGGRLTVVVILARRGAVTWRASRVAVRQDQQTYRQEVAVRRLAPAAAGSPVTATVRYAGSAPTTLRVEAPAGVRWDAVVVFSN